MSAVPASAPAKIDDAGDFLPYARKHLAQEPGPARQDAVTLDDLWPEPDWRELIAGGLPVELAAAIAMMREGLATKPRSAGIRETVSAKEWEDAYREAIPLIRDQLMSSASAEDAFQLNKYLKAHLGITDSYLREHPVHKSPTKEILVYWAAGRGTSTLYSPGNRTLRQAYLAIWLPKLGWPASDANLKASIVPVQLADKTWRAGKVDGRKIVFCDRDPIATEEEAIAAAIRFASTVQTGEAIPTRPTQDKGLEREGPDHRHGEDITPERLMQEFGLRAVQFGNSLTQPERQIWLNQTFDALADLADVLQWPRRWVGLPAAGQDGLGLAFGARGIGSAQAHFESELFALNLTRGKGAGSLAHEWGHAVDSRMGKTVKVNFFSQSIWWVGQSPEALDAKYQMLFACMEAIMAHCQDSESSYWKQSVKIASTRRAGKYWHQAEEMFARGFEAYIEDTLLEQGRVSPWLVHGTLELDYDLTKVAACPYPVGDEREKLNSLYRELIASMASRPHQ